MATSSLCSCSSSRTHLLLATDMLATLAVVGIEALEEVRTKELEAKKVEVRTEEQVVTAQALVLE